MNPFSVGNRAPSLGVVCPGCGAAVGKRCIGKRSGIELYNSHPARRKAADDKRTAEVRASEVRR